MGSFLLFLGIVVLVYGFKAVGKIRAYIEQNVQPSPHAQGIPYDTGSDLQGDYQFGDQQQYDQPSSPYFSYETVEPAPQTPRQTTRKPHAAARAPKADEPIRRGEQQDEAWPAFDLRQAVIAQTILQNDYINDSFLQRNN